MIKDMIAFLLPLFLGILVGFWLRLCCADNKFFFVNGDWYTWGKIDRRITNSCEINTLNNVRKEFGDKITRVEVFYG